MKQVYNKNKQMVFLTGRMSCSIVHRRYGDFPVCTEQWQHCFENQFCCSGLYASKYPFGNGKRYQRYDRTRI